MRGAAREHHHRGRADEAPVRLQRVEVQRHVGQAGREDAARGAARQVAVELVALGQAAAVLVDQLAQRDAGRRQLDARLAHPPADAEGTQALAPVAPVRGEGLGAALDDVAHPVQGLDVVLERGPAEQPDLSDVGRAQPRQAAPALDRLDHGRLLAADVGPGAAPQLDARQRPGRARGQRRRGLQPRELALEQGAQAVVLVTQVDPYRLDAHGPGGNQHALERAVRVALEGPAVLEGAGLALVDVDRHVARPGKAAHDAPLAPGREPRAAQAAQAGVLERGDHLVGAAPPGDAVGQQRVAAAGAVGVVVDSRCGRHVEACVGAQRFFSRHGHTLGRRPRQRPLVHGHGGRLLAATDARRGDDTHLGAQDLRQALQQFARAGELARQAVAHTHGQRRRGRHRTFRPLAHDVEVVVEARDLVDLGLRQAHGLGQRGEVRRAELAVRIVEAVQVLDQQVAPKRPFAHEGTHLGEGARVHPPALGRFAPALAACRRRCCRRPRDGRHDGDHGSGGHGGIGHGWWLCGIRGEGLRRVWKGRGPPCAAPCSCAARHDRRRRARYPDVTT